MNNFNSLNQKGSKTRCHDNSGKTSPYKGTQSEWRETQEETSKRALIEQLHEISQNLKSEMASKIPDVKFPDFDQEKNMEEMGIQLEKQRSGSNSKFNLMETHEPYPVAATISKFAHVHSPDSRALFKKKVTPVFRKNHEVEREPFPEEIKENMSMNSNSANQTSGMEFGSHRQSSRGNNSSHSSKGSSFEETQKENKGSMGFNEETVSREKGNCLLVVNERGNQEAPDQAPKRRDSFKKISLSKKEEQFSQEQRETSQKNSKGEKEAGIPTKKQSLSEEVTQLKEFFWDLVEPFNEDSSISMSVDQERIMGKENFGPNQVRHRQFHQEMEEEPNRQKKKSIGDRPAKLHHEPELLLSSIRQNSSRSFEIQAKTEPFEAKIQKESLSQMGMTFQSQHPQKSSMPSQNSTHLSQKPSQNMGWSQKKNDDQFEREADFKEETPNSGKIANKYSVMFQRKQQQGGTSGGYSQNHRSRNESKSRSPSENKKGAVNSINPSSVAGLQTAMRGTPRERGKRSKDKRDVSASRRTGIFDQIFQDVQGANGQKF